MKLIFNDQTLEVTISDIFVDYSTEKSYGLGCVFNIIYPDGKTETLKYNELYSDNFEKHASILSAIQATFSKLLREKRVNIRCNAINRGSKANLVSFIGNYSQDFLSKQLHMTREVRKKLSEVKNNKQLKPDERQFEGDKLLLILDLAKSSTSNLLWSTLTADDAASLYQVLVDIKAIDVNHSPFRNKTEFVKKIEEFNKNPSETAAESAIKVLTFVAGKSGDEKGIDLTTKKGLNIAQASIFLHGMCLVLDMMHCNSPNPSSIFEDLPEAIETALGIARGEPEALKDAEMFRQNVEKHILKKSPAASEDVSTPLEDKANSSPLVPTSNSLPVEEDALRPATRYVQKKPSAELLAASMPVISTPNTDAGDSKAVNTTAIAPRLQGLTN